MNKITAQETEITIVKNEISDYLSLTDIAKHKDSANTDSIIQNWLRNRNTIELLGFWETIYNPNFKPLEFEGFRKQAGLNSFVLTPKKWIETTKAIGITAKEWRIKNPNGEGNVRETATLEQLVVLSNLESIDSVLIHQGVSQTDRLLQLNQIAITQMKSLVKSKELKKLKEDQTN